jgi:hypothetical protein
MAGQRDWISATEAGRMLQVHPQTVKAWAERGYVVGSQPHPRARHLISLASVERILQTRRQALARLQHVTAEATLESNRGSKIGANSAKEAESGVAVGDEPHKHIAVFRPAVTALLLLARYGRNDLLGSEQPSSEFLGIELLRARPRYGGP